MANTNKQREFAPCNPGLLESLQNREYSKSTGSAIKYSENLLVEYVRLQKRLADIPSDPSTLNQILQEFWPSLRTLKKEEYKASSLLHMRASLRLHLQEKLNLDISNHPAFVTQNAVFDNYLRSLKKRGKGSVQHYEEIPRDDMRLIIQSLSLDDPVQLQMLVWFYIQLYFCKRGMENTQDMKIADIVIEKNGDLLIARLARNYATKNHRELDEDQESGGRMCAVKGSPKCPVMTLQNYISKLHPDMEDLWQKDKRNFTPSDTFWYEKRKLGHNKISEMMKNISALCKLPKVYTNHCVRVSCCTLLGELGFNDTELKSVSKHKSVDSLALYRRIKQSKKVEMAMMMSEAIGLTATTNVDQPSTSISSATTSSAHPSSQHFPFITTDGDAHEIPNFNVNILEEKKCASLSNLPDGDTVMILKSKTSGPIQEIQGTNNSEKRSIYIQNCSNFTIQM
jgi:hypothetical protein